MYGVGYQFAAMVNDFALPATSPCTATPMSRFGTRLDASARSGNRRYASPISNSCPIGVLSLPRAGPWTCAAAGGGAAITDAAPIAAATNTRANEEDMQISRKARAAWPARAQRHRKVDSGRQRRRSAGEAGGEVTISSLSDPGGAGPLPRHRQN